MVCGSQPVVAESSASVAPASLETAVMMMPSLLVEAPSTTAGGVVRAAGTVGGLERGVPFGVGWRRFEGGRTLRRGTDSVTIRMVLSFGIGWCSWDTAPCGAPTTQSPGPAGLSASVALLGLRVRQAMLRLSVKSRAI